MKAKTHADITHLALDLLCQGQATADILTLCQDEVLRDWVVRGVKAEDDWWVPKRLLNWHFYPANSVIAKETRRVMGWKLRPTSQWIIRQRQNELFKKIDQREPAKKIYVAFGRVLHHIQDMSTPSHVVPVYHAASPADPFEAYLVTNWKRIASALQRLDFTPIQGDDDNEDFISAYDRAAERVLQSLSPESDVFPVRLCTGSDVTVNASAFWKSYEQTPKSSKIPFTLNGFGSFGPIGKGYDKVKKYRVGDVLVPIDSRLYLDIAVFYLKFAIEDTMRAITKFTAYHRQQKKVR